jgi:anaerobic magnesium-protoporphyrin IX monomethyl ester cyclase
LPLKQLAWVSPTSTNGMRVLLTTLNAKYIHTNLAIRLLYQLNKDRAGLSWKEFTIKDNQNTVADFCSQFDVVAFSCYIWNISQTLALAKAIKTLGTGTKILLGGPEVSYDWQEIIGLDHVDFIVTGEGEIPFRAFLEQYPAVQNIPNIVQKIGKDVHYFPLPGNFDLREYEHIMPYEDDDPVELSKKVLYIETSRGCPYKCEFCLASLDNKVRYLPDQHIKTTLLHMMQHGRVVKFLDRTFNIKRDFTLDIFKFILANYRPGNVFQFEITADILHPDIIQFIDEHVPEGLFRFEIGIQTVNQQANLAVSRKQNFEKTKGIITQLRHKVEMHLDLIVGLPHDYWADNKHSFETVFKLYPPELQLGFLKFLKGTPMLYKHAQHGYVFDPEPPYQIIQSNYLSAIELAQIEIVEHALEIYWNKNRARNTLRYIAERGSIFDFFLALGNFFGQRSDYHRYTLEEVYNNIADFAAQEYPEDGVLLEIIAVDYFLFHKTIPKQRFFPPMEKGEQKALLEIHGLCSHQIRHAFLPLSFDYQQFVENGEIVQTSIMLIVQYDGREKARVAAQLDHVIA